MTLSLVLVILSFSTITLLSVCWWYAVQGEYCLSDSIEIIMFLSYAVVSVVIFDIPLITIDVNPLSVLMLKTAWILFLGITIFSRFMLNHYTVVGRYKFLTISFFILTVGFHGICWYSCH